MYLYVTPKGHKVFINYDEIPVALAGMLGQLICKRQDYPTASTRIKNCTIPSLVTQIVIPFVRVMSYLHKNDINNKTHTNMYKYT